MCECAPDTTKLASAHQSNVQVKLAAVIWVMPTITERQGVEQLPCQIRATWQLLRDDQLWSVFGSKRRHERSCVAHGSQSRSCKSTLIVSVLVVLCSQWPPVVAWAIIKPYNVHIILASDCIDSCATKPSGEKHNYTLVQADVAGNRGRGISYDNMI